MRSSLALSLALASLACASEAKDRSTPANAFARLARCVYGELDRESRWSIQTIHKLLSEMRALVDGAYPAERRIGAAVYGAWESAAAAADDAGTFAAFCERRACVAEIAAGFGAVVSARELPRGRAEVTTTRGRTFVLESADGAWGLATYREELAAEKIRLADKIVQVRIDAAAFEEQRRATGAGR